MQFSNLSKPINRALYWLPAYSFGSKHLGSGLRTKQEIKDIGEQTLLNATISRFDAAAKHTNIPKGRLDFLKNYDLACSFNLPLERANGKIEQIEAFRIQHKTYNLPTKGGVRISEYFDFEDCHAISLQNTLRSCLLDIPFGGAKGCIKINPLNYTDAEIENLIRRYTIELAKRNMIGASVDVMGPALGTGKKEMNWIKDTFQNFYGSMDINSHACCVGKAYNQGGIRGQIEARGYGVYFTLKTLLDNKQYAEKMGFNTKSGIKGLDFIVQGFGNAGYYTAKYLHENGARLIGVAEHNGSVYNPKGIDPNDLKQYFIKNSTVKNYPGAAEVFENSDVIYKKCDLYCPSYAENQIHKGNVDKFNCKMIVEVANGPVTPAAGAILKSKKVFVFPDILVNAGSFCSTYFEWIKNLSHTTQGLRTKRWEQKSKLLLLNVIQNVTGLRVGELSNSELQELMGAQEQDIVISGIEELLTQAIDQTIAIQVKYNTTLRKAAYINAINKLNDAYNETGLAFSK